MTPESSGRTLKTARSVLQVLRMMTDAPDGVSSHDVAQTLNKSTSTAGYLLNSLCHEGFAERNSADGNYRLVEATPSPDDEAGIPLADLVLAVEELYARSNERTYLATTDDGAIVVHESRGRQGLPRVPGLTERIGGETHAVSIGKTILAHSGPDSVERHRDQYGIHSFTPRTITDIATLKKEIATVRRQGYALDREEFAEGYCCIAAPIFDRDGMLCGSLALSMTSARFEARYQRLIPAVMAMARAASYQGMAPSWEPLASPRPRTRAQRNADKTRDVHHLRSERIS